MMKRSHVPRSPISPRGSNERLMPSQTHANHWRCAEVDQGGVDAAACVAADRSTMRFTTALAPAAITNTAMRANTMSIRDIFGAGDGASHRSERNEDIGLGLGAFGAGRLCVDGDNTGDDRGSGSDNLADGCGAKRRISRASGESEPATIGVVVATGAANDSVTRSSI